MLAILIEPEIDIVSLIGIPTISLQNWFESIMFKIPTKGLTTEGYEAFNAIIYASLCNESS